MKDLGQCMSLLTCALRRATKFGASHVFFSSLNGEKEDIVATRKQCSQVAFLQCRKQWQIWHFLELFATIFFGGFCSNKIWHLLTEQFGVHVHSLLSRSGNTGSGGEGGGLGKTKHERMLRMLIDRCTYVLPPPFLLLSLAPPTHVELIFYPSWWRGGRGGRRMRRRFHTQKRILLQYVRSTVELGFNGLLQYGRCYEDKHQTAYDMNKLLVNISRCWPTSSPHLSSAAEYFFLSVSSKTCLPIIYLRNCISEFAVTTSTLLKKSAISKSYCRILLLLFFACPPQWMCLCYHYEYRIGAASSTRGTVAILRISGNKNFREICTFQSARIKTLALKMSSEQLTTKLAKGTKGTARITPRRSWTATLHGGSEVCRKWKEKVQKDLCPSATYLRGVRSGLFFCFFLGRPDQTHTLYLAGTYLTYFKHNNIFQTLWTWLVWYFITSFFLSFLRDVN